MRWTRRCARPAMMSTRGSPSDAGHHRIAEWRVHAAGCAGGAGGRLNCRGRRGGGLLHRRGKLGRTRRRLFRPSDHTWRGRAGRQCDGRRARLANTVTDTLPHVLITGGGWPLPARRKAPDFRETDLLTPEVKAIWQQRLADINDRDQNDLTRIGEMVLANAQDPEAAATLRQDELPHEAVPWTSAAPSRPASAPDGAAAFEISIIAMDRDGRPARESRALPRSRQRTTPVCDDHRRACGVVTEFRSRGLC